jgi:O-antigen ligase
MRVVKISIPAKINVIHLTWRLLWFWSTANYVFVLLLKDYLYQLSVFNSFVFLLFLLLVVYVIIRKPSLFQSKILYLALIYAGLCVLATLTSPLITNKSLLRALGLLVKALSILLLSRVVMTSKHPQNALIQALKSYFWGFALSIITLFLTNPTVASLSVPRLGDEEVFHPNTIGFNFGIGLLALLYLPMVSNQIMRYFFLGLCGAGLILSFSKTSLIGILISLMVSLFLLHGRKKIYYILLIGASIIPVFVTFKDNFYSNFNQYLSNPNSLTTLTGRTILWGFLLELVSQRPYLGYGYTIVKDVLMENYVLIGFIRGTSHAHNAFVDVLFASGFIGLIAFTLFLIRGLSNIIKASLLTRNKRTEAPFVLGLLVYLLIRSLTEAGLNLGSDFALFIMLAFYAERVIFLSKVQNSLAAKSNGIHLTPSHPLPTARR